MERGDLLIDGNPVPHDILRVLGIETSCDETGVGIVAGGVLLADEVASSALRVNLFDPGRMATRLRRGAYPGEDQSVLPKPADVAPALAALCLAHELDMHADAETELARIWTKVEAIRAKQAGNQVVVVVSARGDTTDDLIELAHEISENPPAREMDMLLPPPICWASCRPVLRHVLPPSVDL